MRKIDEASNNEKTKFEPMVMVDVIADSIKKDIVYGRIKHGSSLSTRKISEDLNVSRTPVREAIRKLEAEGLVNLLPRRGFVVKEYDIDEIREIYHVRKLLESEAIAMACKNFHFSIYCISSNKTLCNIIDNLWYKSFGLLITIFSAPNRRGEIPIEHKLVIDALKTKKKHKVIQALRNHMKETESILISYSQKTWS